MGRLCNFVNRLHSATKREYLPRMNDDKVEAILKAKEYGADYWDGNRRYGYGGYKYLAGRWKPVAEDLISAYGLKNGSRVLDIGFGKGFLLYELQLLLPGLILSGIDVSPYALEHRHPELRGDFYLHSAKDSLPFRDKEFDLVISLNTLHNLRLPELAVALPEMERVGRNGYLVVESYRNPRELFNLECWALTAEAFFDTETWVWIYARFGYRGDYEFIFFE